jgi:hypothetical protein
MKERIKELAEQAEQWNADGDKCEVNLQKFAELIVRECIQAVDNVGGYNEEFHMNAIKEHFGVTE